MKLNHKAIYPAVLTAACLINTDNPAQALTVETTVSKVVLTAQDSSLLITETGAVKDVNQFNSGPMVQATGSNDGGFTPLTGNIVNRGTIDGLLGEDGPRTGILIGSQDVYNGTITNDGSIETETAIFPERQFEAIRIDGTLNGSIVNNGKITGQISSLTSMGGFRNSASGAIKGNFFNGKLVTGDIINDGFFLAADNNDELQGDIINIGGVQGSITNSGTLTSIDNLSGASITGDIVNSGTVRDAIYNQGRITGLINNTGSTRSINNDSGGSVSSIINASGGEVIGGNLFNAGVVGIDIDIGGQLRIAELVGGDIINDGRIIDDGSVAAIGNIVNLGTVRGSIINNGTVDQSIINGNSYEQTGTIDGNVQNEGAANSIVNAAGGSISGDIAVGSAGVVNDTVRNEGTVGGIINNGNIKNTLVNRGVVLRDVVNNGSVEGSVDLGGTVAGNFSNAGTIANGVKVSGQLSGSVMHTAGVISNGLKVEESGSVLGSLDLTGGQIDYVQLNGTVGNNILFGANGGELRGNRSRETVINGSVSGATVIDVAKQMRIGGNLQHNGSLIIQAPAATDYGRVSVAGTAEVKGTVSIRSNKTFDSGTRIQFLEAGVLSSNIQIQSDLIGGNTYTLETVSISDSIYNEALVAVVQEPIPIVPTPDSIGDVNTLNVVSALQTIEATGQATGALADTIALINGAEGEERRVIVDSLEANVTRGDVEGSVNAQRLAVDTINTRQASLRSFKQTGLPAGDGLSQIGFWLQGYGNTQDKDTVDDVSGWDGDTYGLAIGVDKDVSESWAAGAALSYARSEIENNDIYGNTLDIDSYQVSGYGSFVAPTWYSDMVLAYAYNDYQGQRNLVTTPAFATARSDYGGDQIQLRARGGRPFAYDSGWLLTPTASVEYTYLQEDPYTEKDAGTNGLEVEPESVQVLLFTLGGRFAYQATLGNNYTLVPELGLQLRYDAIGDHVQVDTNFIGVNGASFILRGSDIEQTSARATVGLTGYSDGRMSFNVAYDYFYQSDFRAQALTGTLKWLF